MFHAKLDGFGLVELREIGKRVEIRCQAKVSVDETEDPLLSFHVLVVTQHDRAKNALLFLAGKEIDGLRIRSGLEPEFAYESPILVGIALVIRPV